MKAYVNATIRQRVENFVDSLLPEIVAWMQQNRVWKDQTGLARALLRAELSDMTTKYITISLDHGVSYGKWLEVIQMGRYSIIQPALGYWSTIIHERLQKLLNG